MQTTNTYVIIELDFSAMVCSICKQMSAKVKSYYTIQLMLSWLEPKNQKKTNEMHAQINLSLDNIKSRRLMFKSFRA